MLSCTLEQQCGKIIRSITVQGSNSLRDKVHDCCSEVHSGLYTLGGWLEFFLLRGQANLTHAQKQHHRLSSSHP